MKKSLSLTSGLMLSAVLSLNIYGQTDTVSRNILAPSKDAVASKSSNPVTVEKIEGDMAEALTIVQDNYVDGKKLNYNEVFKSSIEGMLHTLDPHSNYFDAKEFEQFRTEQNSQYFGIGATIGDLRDADGKNVVTYIKATFENAPANRAGLRYGDKIVEVNGTSMLGKNFTEVRNFLRGPRGTSAKIVVERFDTGKRETVEIVRDAVPQPSVPEAYMLTPTIGYIAMTGGFNYTTYNEFRQVLAQLKSQGMQELILDLRGNGGGLVNQSEKVANTFLSEGQTIFTQKGRLDGVGEVSRAVNTSPEKMPLILLVNRYSASASEILAGALQDHDRALVIGENTFGKALVTNPYILDYGSMVLLTIAKYETPSGRIIQRDYSDGSLYDYYNKNRDSKDTTAKLTGTESKTDLGRKVYGGGGIMPDEVVPPTTIPNERFRQQSKLLDPIFAFTLNMVYGKIAGFPNYVVNQPIKYNYDLKTSDFSITEDVFQAFKKFAVEKFKSSPALIDKEREFVERNLRTELVTAAYGTTTSQQVFNNYDVQLKRAIELMPKAKQLSFDASKLRTQSAENTPNK